MDYIPIILSRRGARSWGVLGAGKGPAPAAPFATGHRDGMGPRLRSL